MELSDCEATWLIYWEQHKLDDGFKNFIGVTAAGEYERINRRAFEAGWREAVKAADAAPNPQEKRDGTK